MDIVFPGLVFPAQIDDTLLRGENILWSRCFSRRLDHLRASDARANHPVPGFAFDMDMVFCLLSQKDVLSGLFRFNLSLASPGRSDQSGLRFFGLSFRHFAGKLMVLAKEPVIRLCQFILCPVDFLSAAGEP